MLDFEEVFAKFDPDTQRVLLAALWAGKDVHAPLDNLTDVQYERLDELAEFVNSELS